MSRQRAIFFQCDIKPVLKEWFEAFQQPVKLKFSYRREREEVRGAHGLKNVGNGVAVAREVLIWCRAEKIWPKKMGSDNLLLRSRARFHASGSSLLDSKKSVIQSQSSIWSSSRDSYCFVGLWQHKYDRSFTLLARPAERTNLLGKPLQSECIAS